MSYCSNCGYDHPGTGQSPEHPAVVSIGWPLSFGLISILAVIIIATAS